MANFLNLFSPETHAAFTVSSRDVSGFRVRQAKAASRVARGDFLLCYVTRLSRWVGILEVTSEHFEDKKPVFVEVNDPFIVRFKVVARVWLPPELGVPIHIPELWTNLSFTREHPIESTTWTGAVRTSLAPITENDAKLICDLVQQQAVAPKSYPLDAADRRALQPHKVRREEGDVVTVSVPDELPQDVPVPSAVVSRESIKIQALLARIGCRMGFRIWIPAGDRQAVLKEAPEVRGSVLENLPLNYDTTTLRTIENIDVLWLRGRAMARAFEVEHTTAIYSGILRMADLLALQPNMDIRLHIVAPQHRREKVFDEICRPVFSLLQGRPLAERCTFLDYESVRELAAEKHLEHLSDSVLETYEEQAEA